MICEIAKRLGDLCEEVVFLGGATLGLLITDSTSPEMRTTKDVDVIVEVASYVKYEAVATRLRRLGFSQPIEKTEETPTCRWFLGDTVLDVMPTEPEALGFSNRWYPAALRSATRRVISDGLEIRVVTAPCFLATKLEAFAGRGKSDFAGSHDMEDIIVLINGRHDIVDEIKNTDADIREYLAEQFKGLMANDTFLDALPGHLEPDSASQARVIPLTRRLAAIADIAQSSAA
jgi:predicted nucleotidyltransferase